MTKSVNVDAVRQVLRSYVEYHFNEAKNIYHARVPHKDAHKFHLHVPIAVEFELSSMSMYMTTTQKQAQGFVDHVIHIVDKFRKELDRVSNKMTHGQHAFPTNRDTVMEFSK